MSLLPRRIRNVNTTKIPRPRSVLPIASKRSSDFECTGSGSTAIGWRNSSSIAAGETPCFWHLDRLPSSQSNPATRIGSQLSLFKCVSLYSHSSTSRAVRENRLQLHVQPHSRHDYRPAVAVVAWVVDVLNLQRAEESAVHRNREAVVALHDLLGSVSEAAVAQQETESPQREVLLMPVRDFVADERHPEAVARAIPQRAANIAAECDRLVHFRVVERFMLAFVPTGAHESANIVGKFLVGVDAEAVLQIVLHPMVGDFRLRRFSGLEQIDRFVIVAHVGEIGEREQSNGSAAFLHQARPQLKLIVLGMRVLQVLLQVQSIGALRHERLGELQIPPSILVVDDAAIGVAASVRRVVPGAVVHDRPVNEVAVAAVGDGVQIEEVGEVKLANVDVEPANRKLRQDRKRRALDIDRVVTERDYLVIFEPRQVRLGAKVRAPDRIGVNETRESQRLAEPAAARVL